MLEDSKESDQRMAVKSKNYYSSSRLARMRGGAPSVSTGKILGACLWLIGLGTTIAFVHGLTLPLPQWAWSMGYWIEVGIIATIFQALFTKLESPLWKKQLLKPSAWIGLSLDVFTNLNGAWVIVKNLKNTGTGTALNEMTGVTFEATQGNLWIVLIVLIISILLAALPEILWTIDSVRNVSLLDDDDEGAL